MKAQGESAGAAHAAGTGAMLLKELFSPVFAELGAQASLAGPDLETVGSRLMPLAKLLRHPELATIMLESPGWAGSATTGRELQSRTYLGRLFSSTVCPQNGYDVGKKYFAAVTRPVLNRDIDSQMQFLRQVITGYHSSLHTVVRRLLGPKRSRGAVLDWLAEAVQLNTARTQLRHWDFERGQKAPEDPNLANDGFMVNLGLVLVKLCEPFSSEPVPNFEKISTSYFSREPQVSIDSPVMCEPNNATNAQPAGSGGTGPATGPLNFTTDCFYLTLAGLHVGILPVITHYLQVSSTCSIRPPSSSCIVQTVYGHDLGSACRWYVLERSSA